MREVALSLSKQHGVAQLFGVFTGHGLESGLVEADTAEHAMAYAERCCAAYGMRIVSEPEETAGRYSVSLLPKDE